VVRKHWPPEITSDDLDRPALWSDVRRARGALLEALDLRELA
jgi:hypothetical protein